MGWLSLSLSLSLSVRSGLGAMYCMSPHLHGWRSQERDKGGRRRGGLTGLASPPFLCAAIRISLPGIEITPGQEILQVQVALWLTPLHHDHWVGLTEQGPCCSQLSQFYQLNDNLGRYRMKSLTYKLFSDILAPAHRGQSAFCQAA